MAGERIELVGKVISKELKDFGKGKDAEAREVVVVTIKLDSNEGIRGRLSFAPGERAADFDLGDAIRCSVVQSQGKLELAGRH